MKYYSLIILLVSIRSYGQVSKPEINKTRTEAQHYIDSFLTNSNKAKDTMIFLVKGANDLSLKKSLVSVLKLQFRCLDGKSFDQITDSLDRYSVKMTEELLDNAVDRSKEIMYNKILMNTNK